jgi:alpha-L-fucosidase
MLNEDQAKPFTSEDVRFTRKGDSLYAIFMEWPARESTIASLGTRAMPDAVIERVDLLGGPSLPFRRDGDGLNVTIPPETGAFAPAIQIRGRGLV